MVTSKKEVIYIDVDDEITAIIDKVQASDAKIMVLVLPKRATVFQSIVNMKLLKRNVDQAKKNLVLITSEASLLPLAGVVGVHVAKTLQSKPAVPAAPQALDTPVSAGEVEAEDLSDTPLDRNAAIGTLAGPVGDETEEIEVDNDEVEAASAAAATSKVPFNKKLKVPNFESFRTKLFLGGAALVLLIVGWIFAAVVLPKATITIKTDTTDVTSTITLTSSPAIKELDEEKKLAPGILKELKKSDTQKSPATGQKDMGTKASGTVTLSLVDCSKEQVTVPAGTTVSSGSFNFITQVDVTMQSVKIGPNCRNSDFKDITTAKVKVEAQSAGDQYNLSARNYSVSGFGNVSAAGSAMSGGTSKVVKVVSQQDIDSARQKIIDSLNATANQDLSAQLTAEGFYPIKDTFETKNPLVVPSPGVDAEAQEVTVNVTITYTMAGAKQDAVVQLLESDIKQHIDTSKQNILNNGLDKATIRVEEKKPTGEVRFTLQTIAQAGVEQNESAIKQAIMGKKKGDVQSILLARPGVKDVKVSFSPFWVYKTPKKESKLKIIFEQQTTQSTNGSN